MPSPVTKNRGDQIPIKAVLLEVQPRSCLSVKSRSNHIPTPGFSPLFPTFPHSSLHVGSHTSPHIPTCGILPCTTSRIYVPIFISVANERTIPYHAPPSRAGVGVGDGGGLLPRLPRVIQAMKSARETVLCAISRESTQSSQSCAG